MSKNVLDNPFFNPKLPFINEVTKSVRSLPDFVIIGAQKAGTTSLYRYLSTHENIMPAIKKEIHFFDLHYKQGISWYRGHFPLQIKMILKRNWIHENIVTGESSPDYLTDPHTVKRMHKLLPNVKLIVLLRNPIDRAYSHYHHSVKWGHEVLSFENALGAESNRLSREVDKMLQDDNYMSYSLMHHSYLERGKYYYQLEKWLQYFRSNQIHIINSEDFFESPVDTIKQICAFLSIPNKTVSIERIFNKGKYNKLMPKSARAWLASYYKKDNEKLFNLINKRFSWD